MATRAVKTVPAKTTAAKAKPVEGLPNKKKITINGEVVEVFMSYGMINQLAQGIGDAETTATLHSSAIARNFILQMLLSKRSDDGQITEEINVRTLDADVDEINDLLQWAGQHLYNFFLKAMERVIAMEAGNREKVMALKGRVDAAVKALS